MSINRNRFNKRYKLGLLNTMANWIDDIRAKWIYHSDYFWGGFAVGVFAGLVAVYLVTDLVCN